MLALKAYRCHTKHLKRLEWKWPINNTNTTSNLLEKKKKKKHLQQMRHIISGLWKPFCGWWRRLLTHNVLHPLSHHHRWCLHQWLLSVTGWCFPASTFIVVLADSECPVQSYMSSAGVIQTPFRALQSATGQHPDWDGAKCVQGTRQWSRKRQSDSRAVGMGFKWRPVLVQSEESELQSGLIFALCCYWHLYLAGKTTVLH